jgi:hypothetical protein
MASEDQLILRALAKDSVIQDSETFAKGNGTDHKVLVGSIKSLQSYEMIVAEVSLA